mmetsp:Transcript_1889/g.7343  ORF Transcript_1889/g.7343 Transcript_1889/m.7343 type:complete len:202 (+) Transcript_1889:1669-2274(+)
MSPRRTKLTIVKSSSVRVFPLMKFGVFLPPNMISASSKAAFGGNRLPLAGSRKDTMASLNIIPFASPVPVFVRPAYPAGPGEGERGMWSARSLSRRPGRPIVLSSIASCRVFLAAACVFWGSPLRLFSAAGLSLVAVLGAVSFLPVGIGWVASFSREAGSSIGGGMFMGEILAGAGGSEPPALEICFRSAVFSSYRLSTCF